MSLIDYRGFRLIALSILPLERIVYGSNDGGFSVYASDPVFNEKMKTGFTLTFSHAYIYIAAKILNIKGHKIGMKEECEFIYGPTDIGILSLYI